MKVSLLSVIFLLLSNTTFSQLEWESVKSLQGGYSGGLNRSGFKKVDNDIYAFGTNYTYRTTNKGETWEIAFDGKIKGTLDITKTNKSLFCITKGLGTNNILRSTDNGKTWFIPSLNGLPGNEGNGGGDGKGKNRAFCAIEAVGDNLFVMFINGLYGYGYNVFYFSTDEGETWNQAFYLDGDYYSMCNEHDYVGRAYMKSYKNDIIWGDGAKLCRWNLDPSNQRTVYKIPMAMYRTKPVITNSSILIVNTNANNHLMYREIDDSLEMRKILPNGYDNYWGLNLSNEGDEVIFRLLDFKTKNIASLISKDGGKSWEELACVGLPRTAAEFPIFKCDSNIYICPSYNGIYRSIDGMKTFKLANNGFNAIGTDAGFAEDYSYLYKYGNSIILNDSYGLNDIAFYGKLSNLSIGLKATHNDCETWTNDFSLLQKDTYSTDFVKSENLIFLPDYIVYMKGKKMMKSKDAFQTWENIDITGVDTANAKNISVFMYDKNNTYYKVDYEFDSRYFLHKENKTFVEWQYYDPSIDINYHVFSGDTVIFASNKDAQYSINNGDSWEKLNFEAPANYEIYESDFSVTRNMMNVGGTIFSIQMLRYISDSVNNYKNALYKYDKGKMILLGIENEKNMPSTFEILITNNSFKLQNKTLFYNIGKDIYTSTDFGFNFTKVSKIGIPEDMKFVNFATSKDYIYAITDGAGLYKAKSALLSVEDDNISYPTSVNIYPNPTNEIINISDVLIDTKIEITNLLGETVWTGIGKKQINTSEISNGSYLIKVINGDKINCTKIVIWK